MRLIDAEALERHVYTEWVNGELSNSEWIDFRQWLKDEPTVEPSSPWHRVEDELPKDGLIGKLVIDTEGQINICRGYATITLTNGSVVLMDDRILDVFKEETDNWNWDNVTHFTHWMPIEPPKE